MRPNRLIPVFLAIGLTTVSFLPARADDAEAIARHQHVQALESLMETGGDEVLQQFADTHLAPAYRDSFAPGQLIQHLREIRTAAAHPGGILVNRLDDGAMRIRFMLMAAETAVVFRIEPVVPYRITSIELDGTRAVERGPQIKPITWETLESRLDEEAKAGFSGFVYAAHGGKVALARGYGLADHAKKTPVDIHTIFAIGSTPIDFTRAAVLKLEDTGRLATSDPITKYLRDVPADKQAITIDMLMTDTSGFPNFHDIPGTDRDPDLSWIDRDTAERRILGQKLLFVPGHGNAHSHSAWVLLAIIIEKVSGQSYGDFVRKNLFDPAGMTRTFLHEGLADIPDDQIAVGHGDKHFGAINSPKYWGRTSWLVMGSGGMASTAEDLYKFLAAAHGGKLLSPAETKKFGPGGGILVGGDDRGFLCMHAEHGDDMFVFCSNVHSRPGDASWGIGRELGRMVLGAPAH